MNEPTIDDAMKAISSVCESLKLTKAEHIYLDKCLKLFRDLIVVHNDVSGDKPK